MHRFLAAFEPLNIVFYLSANGSLTRLLLPPNMPLTLCQTVLSSLYLEGESLYKSFWEKENIMTIIIFSLSHYVFTLLPYQRQKSFEPHFIECYLVKR